MPNLEGGDGDGGEPEVGKIRQRTMKSRPGAGKRKEKMERGERERFGRNMAVLTAVQETSATAVEGDKQGHGGATATAGRWAALRGFIGQTLEVKEEFKTQPQ